MPSYRILHSPYQSPELPETGVFDYLFSREGEFDSTLPAYVDGLTGQILTRGQLKDRALRLASGLRWLGLNKGDVACLWGVNSLHWIVAACGLMAGGVRISAANYAYQPHEIAHQVNDSSSTLILLDPSALPQLNKARKSFKRSFSDDQIVLLCEKADKPANSPHRSIYELFGTPLNGGRAEVFTPHEAKTEPVWMCYSSGTTGLPKGVQTTHYNITSELQGLAETSEPLRPGESVLGVLPFSHIYGLVVVFMQPLTLGVPVVVFPKYEEHPVLSAISKHRIAFGSVVPPIILSLVNSPNVHKYDISALRALMSGAAPLSASLTAAFETKFPHILTSQAYGNTETTSCVTIMTTEEAKGHQGSCGRLMPIYEGRLIKEDGTDADSSRGEAGELWVRGPSVMLGYHENPEATSKTLTDEGRWYKSGDVMTVDADGYFTVVDRTKELIKYKGFQVPPAELEALLLTHPQVSDAGVIGIWDESQATELPRAYIVAAPGSGVTHADHHLHGGFVRDIAAWVAARVAPHKRLRGGIAVLPAIPKSPSGKIIRKELRERAKGEVEEGLLLVVNARL